MNKPNQRIHPLLQIAVLSVLGGGSLVMAQTRVDRSGANDANNKVGSGGVNQVNTAPNPWQISNAVVNGNVTGGREFRGRVETGDSFAFRGNTADAVSDRFIRNSSGVTTNGVASNNSNTSNLFYGNSRAAPPPPTIASSLVQTGPNGAYVPPSPTSWQTVDPRQQSLNSSMTSVFTPTNGPGAINMQYTPANTSAVPFASLQAQNAGTLSDYTNINPDSTVSQLTPGQVSKIRNSLSGNQSDNGAPSDSTQVQPGQLNNALPAGRPLNGAMNTTGLDDTVAPPSVNNQLAPLPGSEPGMVSRMASAGGDDSTYNSLAQRRSDQEQAMRPGQAAEDAAQQFNQQMKAKKDAADKGKTADQPAPAVGKGPATPGATPTGGPQNTAPGATPKGGAVPPLKVGSLAGPHDNSGVSEMLTKAEDQMRQGKFASAIDTYDTAEALAPKNALIKLGRTNAELGGAYYRRAETSLRQTLTSDKNLLAGQYDLRAFMGDDRLAIVQKDLSDLVQKNPNDVGAAVLLAYVYYNTGNERRAAALLDLADKRAGGKDDFITLLKSNWNLGGADNK